VHGMPLTHANVRDWSAVLPNVGEGGEKSRFPISAKSGYSFAFVTFCWATPELGCSFQSANDSYNLANHLGILSIAQPQELRQPCGTWMDDQGFVRPSARTTEITAVSL
jgi:hypothetical protein